MVIRQQDVRVFLTIISLLVSMGCSMSRQYEAYGHRSYYLSNYADSAAYYEKALSLKPDNKGALLMSGWSYFKMGRYEDARRRFKKLSEVDNNSVDALEGLGWTDFKLGRYREALKSFEAIREKDPLHTGAVEGIAYSYFKMGNGQKQKAKEYLNIALTENPDSSDSCLIYGFISLQESDFSAAIRFFEKALSLSAKEDPDLYAGLGNAHLGSRSYNKADYYYSRALEINPANQQAVAGKTQLFTVKQIIMAEGMRLTAQGSIKAAMEEYRELEKLYPDWAEVYAAKGWALYKGGDYKGAYEEFMQGLKRNKLSYDIYDGLGWSSYRLGRMDEAERSFKRSLEIFPQYSSSQEGLRQLKK
ncbi:MAG: tetratricopeptide repeat protein [Nitrospinae bacterium]|nr:tetratricopeptide repeat protein [Nitrospinota bacterium]MBI3813920.1 tetratricopeptide repeat protein [Nitrospinota bacterium]